MANIVDPYKIKFGRNKQICIRLSEKELGELMQKADLYAGGNIAKYVRAAMHFFRPNRSHIESEKSKAGEKGD